MLLTVLQLTRTTNFSGSLFLRFIGALCDAEGSFLVSEPMVMKMKYAMAGAGITLMGVLGLMRSFEPAASGTSPEASKPTKRPRVHSESVRLTAPAEESTTQQSDALLGNETPQQSNPVPQWQAGTPEQAAVDSGNVTGDMDRTIGMVRPEVLQDSRTEEELSSSEWNAQPRVLGLPLANRPVQMPLSHALTSEEISQIAPEVPSSVADQVRDEFDQDAGVNQLPPDSPEYHRRWVSAQEIENEKLRARYGWGAYAALQKEAVLKALAENPQAKR